MAFTEAQIRELSSKLHRKHVKTREIGDKSVSYIEGWHVIAEANRVFGFDSWDREMIWCHCVWEDARRDPKACAYAARVRIRVRAQDVTVYRDGSGVGHGTGARLSEAHESALKEAETDAMKRALVTFGNVFGLALYDRDQAGVRGRLVDRDGFASLGWIVLSADGHTIPAAILGVSARSSARQSMRVRMSLSCVHSGTRTWLWSCLYAATGRTW